MNVPTKVFFPNLDGLRFFAFFAVFIHHAVNCLGFENQNKYYDFFRTNFLQNGDLGVSFFFALSGFLITYLLLKEKEASGKISIKNFYVRRILRIWPVYFLVVGLCLLVFPLLNNHIPQQFPIGVSTSTLNPWLYLTFLGNFDYLHNGISNVLIGVLWSVSVEEQFYLFWPLLIAFIPKKYLLPSFLIIMVSSIGYRYFFTEGKGMLLSYHSFSCVTYLAAGAVIAALATNENFVNLIKRIPKYIIIIIYLIGITMLPFRQYIWKFGAHYVLVATFVPVALALFFAFIILEQNYGQHSFFKISNWKFISSLGKYTYGMYCYHMIVFFVVLFTLHLMGVETVGMNSYAFISIFITSLFSTILISILSYHYFETFFLKLKEKFN